jgi:hypothetical protein
VVLLLHAAVFLHRFRAANLSDSAGLGVV